MRAAKLNHKLIRLMRLSPSLYNLGITSSPFSPQLAIVSIFSKQSGQIFRNPPPIKKLVLANI